MTTPAVDRWWDLAHQLLDAVVSGFDELGLELPGYRYVSPTPTPPVVGEMLAVGLSGVAGTGGNIASPQVAAVSVTGVSGQAMRAATYTITLLRLIPVFGGDDGNEVLGVPSPAAMSASARAVMGDHHALVLSLLGAYKAGALAGCGGVAIGASRAQGSPDGGLGGLTQVVTLSRL